MSIDMDDVVAQYVFLKTCGLKNTIEDIDKFEKQGTEINAMLEKQALFLLEKEALFDIPGALGKVLSGSLAFITGLGTRGLESAIRAGELGSDVFLTKIPAMTLGGGALGGGLWWLMNKQREAQKARQKARLSQIEREIAKYTPGYRPIRSIHDA